jgi:hypothetical protein
MGKEKIVKYTSEELKKLKDESDWERAAGITDEEIEAADAQDSEVVGIDNAWMDKAEVVRPQKKGSMPSSTTMSLNTSNTSKKADAAIRAG